MYHLKIYELVMNFQKFALDAQFWMKYVCHELFTSDIITSHDGFDFLFDSDFHSWFGSDFKPCLAIGFSVVIYRLSMDDSVFMNRICAKHGCFYVIYPSENNSLSIHFYLENHG